MFWPNYQEIKQLNQTHKLNLKFFGSLRSHLLINKTSNFSDKSTTRSAPIYEAARFERSGSQGVHILSPPACASNASAEFCVNRAWGSEIVTQSAAVAEHDLTAPCSIYA